MLASSPFSACRHGEEARSRVPCHQGMNFGRRQAKGIIGMAMRCSVYSMVLWIASGSIHPVGRRCRIMFSLKGDGAEAKSYYRFYVVGHCSCRLFEDDIRRRQIYASG